MPIVVLGSALVGTLFATAAIAQAPPDYGMEWRTIGSPGNADASPAEFIWLDINGWGPSGRVDHEFRLTRTEITVSQYFEFVQAYSPFHPGGVNDVGFQGRFISSATGNPNDPRWRIEPGSGDHPADMSWYMAARFCNWNHNGRINEAWAFEGGAYDASDFRRHDDGTWGGPATHEPGARYWIPDFDEWVKGMYYDPHKFGQGRPGYWLYPHSGDQPPVGGLPGTPGAQTGAGEYDDTGNPFREYPVGSYPNAMSPWGLLDGSGGVREFLEFGGADGSRVIVGSDNSPLGISSNILGRAGAIVPWAPGFGLRMASTVPSPSIGALAVLVGLWYLRTRSVR